MIPHRLPPFCIEWRELFSAGEVVSVRRKCDHRSRRRMGAGLAAAAVLAAAFWRFDGYVNQTIKPTLHKLAEYEARDAAAQAVSDAASAVAGQQGSAQELLTISGNVCQLDTGAANQLCSLAADTAQAYLAAAPLAEYTVPFGSLTDDTLFSGRGPGWHFSLQPRGYVQSTLRQHTESLSVNTTRYSAEIELTLTMDLILDSTIETLTFTGYVPLATVLWQGDVPQFYSSAP